MREMKFRGKRTATKKWVYGGYAEYDDHAFVIDNGNYTCVIPDTVGQYTGLKDKNGKEIFEGDILDWADKEVLGDRFECIHKHGAFGYEYLGEFHPWGANRNFSFATDDQDENFVVLGNIYDNPELLKGGEE